MRSSLNIFVYSYIFRYNIVLDDQWDYFTRASKPSLSADLGYLYTFWENLLYDAKLKRGPKPTERLKKDCETAANHTCRETRNNDQLVSTSGCAG